MLTDLDRDCSAEMQEVSRGRTLLRIWVPRRQRWLEWPGRVRRVRHGIIGPETGSRRLSVRTGRTTDDALVTTWQDPRSS